MSDPRPALSALLSARTRNALDHAHGGQLPPVAATADADLVAACARARLALEPVARDFELAASGLRLGPLRLGIAQTAAEGNPDAWPDATGDILARGVTEPPTRTTWLCGVDKHLGANEYLYLDDRGRLFGDQDLEVIRCVAPNWPQYLERRAFELDVPTAGLVVTPAHVGEQVAGELGASRVDPACSDFAVCYERAASPRRVVIEYLRDDFRRGTDVYVDASDDLLEALQALHRLAPDAPLNTSSRHVATETVLDDPAAWNEVPAGARLVLEAPCLHHTMGKEGKLRIFEREGRWWPRYVVCYTRLLDAHGRH